MLINKVMHKLRFSTLKLTFGMGCHGGAHAKAIAYLYRATKRALAIVVTGVELCWLQINLNSHKVTRLPRKS